MTTPHKCPSCGCAGSMIRYRALFGAPPVPREVLRCLCCNTGSVLAPHAIGE